jgi:integrase
MVKRRPLPWGSGYIQHRGDRYQARWPENGRWRARTFPTEDDAIDFLTDMARHKRRGTYVAPSQLTVGDVLDEFLNRPSQRVSESTLFTYRARAETMIRPYLGERRITELRTIDVQRWIDRLASDYAPGTIRPALAVLSAAMREAKTLGLIDANPVDGVRRPSLTRTQLQTWTEEEARRVLAVVEDDELFQALYHVAIGTGMRPGELRALRWEDVKIDRAQLRVARTITKDNAGREVMSERTKTVSARVIALTEHVCQTLKWHRARQAERQLYSLQWFDENLVFDRGDGHWLSQSVWRKEHQRICAAAGVPVIRLHDIRHTFATMLLERGVHVKIASDILGHGQIQTTLNIYQHVSPALQRSVLDELGKSLFGDGEPEDLPASR